MTDSEPTAGPPRTDPFPETRWSQVRGALADDSKASEALAGLCRSYWQPLYAYVRCKGHSEDDALDLTQGFLARLVERRDFAGADPGRGRFRAYLLAAMKHYLSDAHRRERAAKRGFGRNIISLDADGETLHRIEPLDYRTPERAYVRQWAVSLLERTTLRLRDRYAADGREAHFDALRETLAPGGSLDAQSASQRLGMTVNAVHVAAHRLRAAFRDLVRAEIGETVDDPGDIDDELRALMEAFRS